MSLTGLQIRGVMQMSLVVGCKQCGFVMSKFARRCPRCGAEAAKMTLTTKIVIGFFALTIIGAALPERREATSNPELASAPAPVAAQKQSLTVVSAAEHLDLAKKALAGWKPHKDPAKAEWGDLKGASIHLKAIKESDPEYPEAKKLSEAVKARQDEVNNALLALAAKEAAQRRKDIAEKMELHFLDSGMDVHVSAAGKDGATLKIDYVLMSRPFAHKFINAKEQINILKLTGFKRIEFWGGRQERWSYDM